MQPLEGLYYFTKVVDHGGFAREARALGIPKSRLSRHVVALEGQLNVRLSSEFVGDRQQLLGFADQDTSRP